MRMQMIAVGEKMPSWVARGFETYIKRMPREYNMELLEIRPGKRGKGQRAEQAMQTEAKAIMHALEPATHVVLLDEHGQQWSSLELSRQLGQWRMQGQDLAFVIGGAEGHATSMHERADQCWSLGRLTLPHMLVRLVLMEQLYRAATILMGHPYHRA